MTQSSKCLDDDTLYRYIDNQLKGKNLRRVEHHINECPACLSAVTELIKLTTIPITDEEKEILETIERVPVEERLEAIMKHGLVIPDEKAEIKKSETAITRKSKLSSKKPNLFRLPHFAPRFQFAFAVLAIIGIVSGFRFYQTRYQAILAEKLLEENFQISRNEFRLSGDYSSSSLGGFLGDEDSLGFVKEAQDKINSASERGLHSSKMMRIQSHIFLLKKEFAKADSLLLNLSKESSASTLNDLAFSAYQQGKDTTALEFLQRSYSMDSTLTQTLYNLGVYYQNNQDYAQAMSFFEKSLNQEHRKAWRDAIQKRITEIKQEM